MEFIERNINNIDHEICIIGTGPAGAVIASSLLKRGHKVLIIEFGSDNKILDNSFGINSIKSNGHLMNIGRSFMYGGTSNDWSGRIVKPDMIDFQERGWVSDFSSPIKYDQISNYFDEALNILGISKKPSYSFKDSKINFIFNQSQFTIKNSYYANKKFNAAEYLDNHIFNNPNITIKKNIRALRFLQKSKDRIDSVEVCNSYGEKFKIKSSNFVLACGGIENTRILFNSNNIFKEGLGNGSNLLGKFLSTHPKANVGFVSLKNKIDINNPLFIDYQTKFGKLRSSISLKHNSQIKFKLLNHQLQLCPISNLSFNRTLGLFKKNKTLSDNNLKGLDLEINLRDQISDIKDRIFIFKNKHTIKYNHFVIRGFFDQYPSELCLIKKSSIKDLEGVNMVDIDWSYSKRDILSISKYLKLLDKEIREKNIGKVFYKDFKQNKFQCNFLHSHFIGTTRMGTNERNSVCDKFGRIHGISNLWISGPSIFSNYGFANPTLNIVSIALYQAEHISDKLKNEKQ